MYWRAVAGMIWYLPMAPFGETELSCEPSRAASNSLACCGLFACVTLPWAAWSDADGSAPLEGVNGPFFGDTSRMVSGWSHGTWCGSIKPELFTSDE